MRRAQVLALVAVGLLVTGLLVGWRERDDTFVTRESVTTAYRTGPDGRQEIAGSEVLGRTLLGERRGTRWGLLGYLEVTRQWRAPDDQARDVVRGPWVASRRVHPSRVGSTATLVLLTWVAVALCCPGRRVQAAGRASPGPGAQP